MERKPPYQKLHFLTPPAFAVERIMASAYSSYICVWGGRGVTIAELPARWGRGGLFDSGKQTVLCKSSCLDERFLYTQTEVRRVHWHPSSLSHVLVLVSGNIIRLYNIALKSGPKLVKMFNIGPKPVGYFAGDAILDSLGDTAVDFTPTPDQESLLILRGNGDVYMMSCDLDSKSPLEARVRGPLAMYPPADDNYGTDSCCIATLGGGVGSGGGGGELPSLVVIATCSAALYHCLLLPTGSEGNDGDKHALYVIEAVELNVVLNPDDEDMRHSYPVHLYPCTNDTYACVHAGGVHSITLPIMGHLKDFALADEVETESVLSAMCSKASVARHLACTSRSAARPTPPVGLARTHPPMPTLLLLCEDANLLLRTLEPYDLEDKLYKEMQLKNPALEQEDINKILKQRQKLSFTEIIREILTRDVSQPILNINKTEEPSPKESLEFLTQAMLKLRGEYILRQQRAMDAMLRKISALTNLGHKHNEWVNELTTEIDDMQLMSMVFKERVLLAEKRQEDIKYRCSMVLRKLRSSSLSTPAERELLEELEKYKKKGEAIGEQISLLKEHAQQKDDVYKKWRSEYTRKDKVLGKSHSDTISSILQQQTTQISTLIEETKLLKDQLSIV